MSTDERLAKVAALVEAALDLKGDDIVALDVRAATSFTDTLVIVSATSDRRARSISDSITEAARGVGMRVLGIEGYNEGRWILIDLGDVVAHVFLAPVRQAFDLERLWSDAPVIPVAGAAAQTAAR